MNRLFAALPLLLAPLGLIQCQQATRSPFYVGDDGDTSNAGAPSNHAGEASTDPTGGSSAASGGRSAGSGGAATSAGGAAPGFLRTTSIKVIAFDDDFKIPINDLESSGTVHAAMNDGSWKTVPYSGSPINLPPFSGKRRWLRFVPNDLERYVPTIVEQVEGHDDGKIGVVVRGDMERIQNDLLSTGDVDSSLETNVIVRVVAGNGDELIGAKVEVEGASLEAYENTGDWYPASEAVSATNTKGLALASEMSAPIFPGKLFTATVTTADSGTFQALVAQGETTVFVHYAP